MNAVVGLVVGLITFVGLTLLSTRVGAIGIAELTLFFVLAVVAGVLTSRRRRRARAAA